MASQILTEAGTNELEVLVFSLGKTFCGVNVAKVREVIGQHKARRVPAAHPAVVGVTNLRGKVITLLDLQLYFYPGQPSTHPQRHVIVTEFNERVMGFVVDGVERIYRLGWESVKPVPFNLKGIDAASVTSICEIDGKLVLMIDFEKIAFTIEGVQMAEAAPGGMAEARTGRILLAEDSAMMRAFIERSLRNAGYTNLTIVEDGAAAWEQLEAVLNGAAPFDAIVSDLEMPRMDGLHLCRRVKQTPQLRDVPFIVFSSIAGRSHDVKLNAVGADAALTKPRLPELVEIVDRLIAGAPVGA